MLPSFCGFSWFMSLELGRSQAFCDFSERKRWPYLTTFLLAGGACVYLTFNIFFKSLTKFVEQTSSLSRLSCCSSGRTLQFSSRLSESVFQNRVPTRNSSLESGSRCCSTAGRVKFSSRKLSIKPPVRHFVSSPKAARVWCSHFSFLLDDFNLANWMLHIVYTLRCFLLRSSEHCCELTMFS